LPKNINILLVEDSRINQAVMMGILSSWGMSADIANNGQEAIDILTKQKDLFYQIVLMDCQMPIMDGYEASQAIRSGQIQTLPHDIPIIAMTGNAMEGDKEKCLAAGMNDYLSKPVDATMLLEKIQHWLNIANTNSITETNVDQAASVVLTESDTWQYNQLLVRMRNNQAMIKKLIELFIEDNGQVKAQLKHAIEKNNLAEVKSIAHKIKGSARNLSFINLGDTLNAIELSAKEQKVDNLSEHYRQFIREYDNLMPLLTKYITN
jgi:CheY-like chemotaxis protein/HPt (histidine-containing phosphotransfer) domain-containing protein